MTLETSNTHTRKKGRTRKPFHVFERDSNGAYTIQVYAPIESVIGYLRNQRWNESQSTNEALRIYSLLDAIDVCNAVANADYIA